VSVCLLEISSGMIRLSNLINLDIGAVRPRLFAPGILYHVIVRGNYRQKTFLNRRDYDAYLERLARYRKRFGVTVYAYC